MLEDVDSSFRADLHSHTTYSDGSLSPSELVELAHVSNLSAISITDHETLSAYPEAIQAASHYQIMLGTGVEFSSYLKGYGVHILGYDVSLHAEDLYIFCKSHRESRQQRNRDILKRLAYKGMPLEEKELESVSSCSDSPGRPHIALAMVKKGYVKNTQEAFRLYIGEGRPCFCPGFPFSISQTIDVIHAAGGKAFLAHPQFLNREILFEALTYPLDGLECHYGGYPPEQEKKWVQLAKKHHLLISGGSDFHGQPRPHIRLGSSWVNRHLFNQIFEKPINP